MNINEIKERLESIGCRVSNKTPDVLHAGFSPEYVENFDFYIINKAFVTQIINGKINVKYFIYQTDGSKDFDNIETYMDFVKNELPLIP